MKQGGAGCIVNMSSVAGYIGISGQTNYSAAKSALISFTSALSSELARDNITVYGIAPGYIGTEMLSTIPSEMLDKFVKDIPMNRIGSPDEIGTSIAALVNGAFPYCTGRTIVLDGGLCAV
jgi:NAD(P)-dependent dehydrogenase (short-subunit alcohol dehydrogenase family)